MTVPFEPGARVAHEFGRAMQALHLRMGGDAAQATSVGHWAALAWGEADAGHVCVDVPGEAERAALGASPVVGPSGEPLPLVLDRGALYLHRLWRAETTLARAVRTLDTEVPFACDGGVARAVCGVFDRADPVDPQQRAVACGLERGLTVLSGGRAPARRRPSRACWSHSLAPPRRRASPMRRPPARPRRGSLNRWPLNCPASIRRASCVHGSPLRARPFTGCWAHGRAPTPPAVRRSTSTW